MSTGCSSDFVEHSSAAAADTEEADVCLVDKAVAPLVSSSSSQEAVKRDSDSAHAATTSTSAVATKTTTDSSADEKHSDAESSGFEIIERDSVECTEDGSAVALDSSSALSKSAHKSKSKSKWWKSKSKSKSGTAAQDSSAIYHEKQHWRMCLLNSINGILQGRFYTSKGLDEICHELDPDSFINPHKSVFGDGNYDANVLMIALQRREREVQWFDCRLIHAMDVGAYESDELFDGLIVNVMQKKAWGILKARHWFALKYIDSQWYSLDGKSEAPVAFASAEDLRLSLVQWVDECDAQVLVVFKKHTAVK